MRRTWFLEKNPENTRGATRLQSKRVKQTAKDAKRPEPHRKERAKWQRGAQSFLAHSNKPVSQQLLHS